MAEKNRMLARLVRDIEKAPVVEGVERVEPVSDGDETGVVVVIPPSSFQMAQKIASRHGFQFIRRLDVPGPRAAYLFKRDD